MSEWRERVRKEGKEGERVRGRKNKLTLHLLRQGQGITHSKGNPLLIHSFWDCRYTGEEHFPFLLQIVRDLALLLQSLCGLEGGREGERERLPEVQRRNYLQIVRDLALLLQLLCGLEGGKEGERERLPEVQRRNYQGREGGREAGATYLHKGSRELKAVNVLISPSQGKCRTTHSAA